MINDLPLFFDIGGKNSVLTRPIRMGFFHFSNNNLAIRKQCAQEIGMYDPAAAKAEDVDLCFRLAMSSKWVAWRENAAVLRHKGRRTWWELIKQMWGYGFYVGYPYAKTGIRGVFAYCLSGRKHRLLRRFETESFPILVCAFITDFHFIHALLLTLMVAAWSGHVLIPALAAAGLLWLIPRYLHDVTHLSLKPWDTLKLAVVHYSANLGFTIGALASALKYRVILIPSTVFKMESPGSPVKLHINEGRPERKANIRDAERYTPARDLWVVTCYFNPLAYASRLRNYYRFLAPFEGSRERLITVECALDDQPFTLSGPDIVRVRASDVMWQKERLLNLAISELPTECQKVVWIDCDILFENPDWLVHTSKLLDNVVLVQPFQQAVYLGEACDCYSGEEVETARSFASVLASDPIKRLGGDFRNHGHTGFVWAARRGLLAKHGLYEASIGGGADHIMAHAACGDLHVPCVDHSFMNFAYRNHFLNWAASFWNDVRGRLTYVPGSILHLWHGSGENKKVYENLQCLAAHDFNPNTDIRVGNSGCLEWNSHKPELHRRLKNYFALRKEDGEREPVAGF